MAHLKNRGRIYQLPPVCYPKISDEPKISKFLLLYHMKHHLNCLFKPTFFKIRFDDVQKNVEPISAPIFTKNPTLLFQFIPYIFAPKNDLLTHWPKVISFISKRILLTKNYSIRYKNNLYQTTEYFF